MIVSKDEDFPQRVLSAQAAPQVLWLRVGNTSNRALREWLQPLWPDIERSLAAGERVVEVVCIPIADVVALSGKMRAFANQAVFAHAYYK